jgi:hypothetical protein
MVADLAPVVGPPQRALSPPDSLEPAISLSGLRFATFRQSEWGECEFQTVTEAASKGTFRRPFPTVDPLADESGTFPWVKSDLVASLL